jgi:hypothetical protein
VNIERLDRRQFVEDGARRQARRKRPEACVHAGSRQAIGHECNEHVCLDTMLQLMVDRSKVAIVLEILERDFDLNELHVELPEMGTVLSAQIA